MINNDIEHSVTISRTKHLCFKTCWQNGEVSWVCADALREQHPWTLANYAIKNSLLQHPRFDWTQAYISQQQHLDKILEAHALTAKGNQSSLYKF